MKKDKLYTLSKYSADRINEKANLFPIGGLMYTPSPSITGYQGLFNPGYQIPDYYNGIANYTPQSLSSFNTAYAENMSPYNEQYYYSSNSDGVVKGMNKHVDIPSISISDPRTNSFINQGLIAFQKNNPLGGKASAATTPKWQQAAGVIGGIVGGVGSKLISGGYSTGGVGEGITGIGGAVGSAISKVNPLVGGIVSAGSGILGGLVNRGFGVKRNDKNIASIKSNTGNIRSSGNRIASATTNEAFMDAAANMGTSRGFKQGDLVKGGWFSGGKASREANKYLNAEKAALAYQTNAMSQGAKNVDKIQDDLVASNFAAEGGQLNTIDEEQLNGEQYADGGYMGALEYGLLTDALNARKKGIEAKDRIPSNPFGALAMSPNLMAFGGPFTYANGGGIEIKHPGRLTELKKRTGKTEAQLWSEGDPEVRKMITFARNARKWQKAYGGLLEAADNFYAIGGDIQMHGGDFTTGATHIDAGGSHEENPYDGVQVGVDPEGTPNLVEEGEVIYNDYVYSQRIELDEEAKEKFHFSKKQDITYADAVKKLEKEISERPNDPLSKAAFSHQMSTLAEEQERQKAEMQAEEAREQFESLSPEEQITVMQNAEAQEQQAAEEEAMMQEQAAQEQAMQEQGMQQDMPPEEQMMQEQMMAQQQGAMPQQPMGLEVQMGGYAEGGQLGNEYAMGGNLFADGGYTDVLKWLMKNHAELGSNTKSMQVIAKLIYKMSKERKTSTASGEPNYAYFYGKLKPTINYNKDNVKKYYQNLINAGVDDRTAFSMVYPNNRSDSKEMYAYVTNTATNTTIPKSSNVVQAPKSIPRTNKNTPSTSDKQSHDYKYNKALEAWQYLRSLTTKEGYDKIKNNNNMKEAVNAYVNSDKTIDFFKETVTPDIIQFNNASKASDVQEAPLTEQSQQQNSSDFKVPASKTSKTQEKKSGLYAGEWIEGDSSANWNKFSSVGLKNYLQDVVNRINNAENDEQKNNIRQEAINKVAQIQQAYARAYQPDITPTSERPEVYTLQELFDDAGGNAGFEKIAENIKKSNAARNKDTAANNWRDSLWGPRTSIRNWGSTEYGAGNQDYYNEIAGLATQAGLQYAPNASWTYGKDAEGNPYQLYGLSRAGTPQPAKTPVTIHQMINGDQISNDPSQWVGVGDVVGEPITLDDGTIIIQHAPAANAPEVQTKAAEAAETPQAAEQGNTARAVAPVLHDESLRYAGLFGPALGLGMMATGIGKPDLSSYDAILESANNGGSYANYMPIGNYLKYQPMDIWANQNRMDANSRATDRALLNNSSPIGTRNAGLIANSYASQLGSGELYRKALEYNDALRKQTAEFNRDTDKFNAEAFNRASVTNAELANRNNQFRAQLGMQAAAEKAAADAGWYNSLYGNVNSLFKGIGDLGKERAQRNMIAKMAAAGVFGTLTPENAVGAGLVKWADEEESNKKKRKKGLTV